MVHLIWLENFNLESVNYQLWLKEEISEHWKMQGDKSKSLGNERLKVRTKGVWKK